MIELIYIFFFCIFVFSFFSFSFLPIFLISKKNYQKYELNYYIVNNIIILFLLIFIFVILKINFYILVLVSIFSYIYLLFFKYQEFKNFLKKNISSFIDYFFLLIIFYLISVSIVANLGLWWDGNYWVTKAQVFYNYEGVNGLKNTIHINYPFLGPSLWAFTWKLSIISYEVYGRLFYIFFYIISIYLITSFYFKSFTKKILITSFFIFICNSHHHLFLGYQEVLLFSMILIILLKFKYYLKFGDNLNLIFLIISLFLLLMIKQEGFLAFIILSYLIFRNFEVIHQQTKIKILLILICIIIFKFLLFKLFFYNVAIEKNILADTLHIKYFILNLENIETLTNSLFLIMISIFKVIFKNQLFLVFLLLIFINKQDIKKDFFLIFIILLVYSSPFLFTDPEAFNLQRHLNTSLYRVTFSATAFFIPIILNIIKNQKLYK